MKIHIAERLKPYSHLPGTRLVLPGSSLRLNIFPAYFEVDDLSGGLPKPIAQVAFRVAGPVQKFTVEQDLEKGLVRVWGHSTAGYFRYCLMATADLRAIQLKIERGPAEGIAFQCAGKWSLPSQEVLISGNSYLLTDPSRKETECSLYYIPQVERLSLGNHKAQDWELIRRRGSFTEIFPLWHRLGHLLPDQNEASSIGTLALLKSCRQAIEAAAPETILSKFHSLFLAGFESALSPQLLDSNHQGLIVDEPPFDSKVSPLLLLTEGAALIRTLFIQMKGDEIILLPACPPEFHCGRFIDIPCGLIGVLSLEWTKKAVRCATFKATSSQEIIFTTGDGQTRCRLRHSFKDKGVPFQLGSKLKVTAGENYWFDNFLN